MQEQKENFIQNQGIENTDSIDIKAELGKYLVHWRWFVFGALVTLSVAYTYLRYATPQYSVSGAIMIKDNNKSGISSELAAFEDLGIIGGSSANNTDNEIYILKSRKIIGNAVDSLGLTLSYFVDGRVRRTEVYKQTPVAIDFIKEEPNFIEKDTAFVISIIDKDNFEFKNLEGDVTSMAMFNTAIESQKGTFKVRLFQPFTEEMRNKTVLVTMSGRNKVIDRYRSRINVSAIDKNSSVLNLTLTDAIKIKAEDILNELVKQYNIDAIKDKNIVSEKTKDFIEDRLQSIGSNLGVIQDNVKNYKIKFGITGLSEEGSIALQSASVNNQKIVQLES